MERIVNEPPKELFVLIWDKPFTALITHDISDWGHKNEPPKHFVRYELCDWGDVRVTDVNAGGEESTMDSQEGWPFDGDKGPPDIGDSDESDAT